MSLFKGHPETMFGPVKTTPQGTIEAVYAEEVDQAEEEQQEEEEVEEIEENEEMDEVEEEDHFKPIESWRTRLESESLKW